MNVKKIIIYLLTSSLMFTCGCWDRVEIDQRAFVFSMAVDLNKGGNKGSEKGISFEEPLKNQSNKIKVIYFTPMPSKVAGGGGSSGGGGEETYVSEESKGNSVAESIRNLSLSFGRTPFFGQTKVLLLGENLLSNPKEFKGVLDFIERAPDIGRTMNVAVVKGDVEDLRNIKVQFDKVFAFYISNLFETVDKNTSIETLDINEFLSRIREDDGSLVVPYVTVKDNRAEVESFALIKNYKLIGNLDLRYIRSYSYLTGKLKYGRKFIEYNDNIIPYRIDSFNRKIWVDDENGKLKFTVKMKTEGDIEQYNFGEEASDEVIDEIRSKLESDTRKEIQDAVKYFQKDLGYDFLGFDDYTQRHYYNIYQKYKDNWNEAFKNADIEYDINMHIRRIGPEQ